MQVSAVDCNHLTTEQLIYLMENRGQKHMVETSKPSLYSHTQPSDRFVYGTLAGLLLVGLALRIFIAHVSLGGLAREYEYDEGGYVTVAMRIAQGLGFVDSSGKPTSFLSPGLPFLVAIPISLLGHNIVVIRVLMCLIESLLIPACYLLGASISGSRQVGLIAAAIAVLFPTWIVPSGTVMTDIPAAILIVCTGWMLIEAYHRKSPTWCAGSGILWGVATMVRPVTLSYAPGIIVWLLLVFPGWKMRLSAVAATLIAFTFVVAPWSIRNTYVYGTFVLTSTQGGSELYKANNPNATGILAVDHMLFSEALQQRYPKEEYPNEAVRSEMFQADARRFILENPRRFAELCFIRFIQLWKVYSPRVPLIDNVAVIGSLGLALPFFLIQVIRSGWRRGPEMLLVLIVLCHTAVHVVYTSIVRYRIPIEPLVIILAIQGFYWAFGRIEHRV